MAEYIERGALMQFPIRRDHYDRKNGNKHFINGIESVLEYAEQLPTVDAEVVVRCKDCKYSYADLEGLCCTCKYEERGNSDAQKGKRQTGAK
jgi:hypothetical protein